MKNNRFFVFRFILLSLVFISFGFVYVKNVSADVDTTPPTGTILINGGALYTNSRNVTLTLSATDDLSGVIEMQFNNGAGSYSSLEPYATIKAWMLSASGDGLKTVRVKFKDGAGNVNTPGIPATITLDTVIPVITLNGDSIVNINVGDTYTELGASAFDNNKGTFSAISSGLVDTNLAGTYTITYSATDDAGNNALPITRTVNVIAPVLPPPPPAPTLSSISITTPANKLDYKIGETLDISGLVITGTYSDNSTKKLDVALSNIFGFDSSSLTSGQILTVSIEGKTTSYSVNILADEKIAESPPIVNPPIQIENIVRRTSGGGYLIQPKTIPLIQTVTPVLKTENKIENNGVKNFTEKTKIEKPIIKNIEKSKFENKIEPTSQTAAVNEAIPNNKIDIFIFVGLGILSLVGLSYKIFKLK